VNDLINNGVPSMSTHEIAELTGKRHDHVIRDVRKMVEDMVSTDAPEMGNPKNQGVTEVTDARGYTSMFMLDKRMSMILVSGYSVVLRARIIDRWQELEAMASAPKFAIPTTLSGALRLAAEQAEEIERQAAQLEAQKPAVEFVDRYTSADGNKGFREVAKLLNANEREFRAFLISNEIMYRLDGRLTAYAHHQHASRFAVKTGIGGNEHAFTQSMFTPKGIEWVAGKWATYLLSQSETV
jgi:phage antirepressor YoqD-like protein